MTDTNQMCNKCGKPMAVKEGKFGEFLACTGYPECTNTQQMNPVDKSPGEIEIPAEDKTCQKCNKPMAIKNGKFGPFLACTGYPDCHNIKNIEQKTGVKCPECGKGDIIIKRSRQGKIFYACNQYPQCKFALWSKPTGKNCEKCQSLMVASGQDSSICSNKDCK